MGIEIGHGSIHDECKDPREKDCREKHTLRVANATLEIAIDVHTDFDCKTDEQLVKD